MHKWRVTVVKRGTNACTQHVVDVFIKQVTGRTGTQFDWVSNSSWQSAPKPRQSGVTASAKCPLVSPQPHLSIRFISWSPSPLRKRSRLAGSMRQEHKASKRFSIISCSSAVDGLWRLNTCGGQRRGNGGWDGFTQESRWGCQRRSKAIVSPRAAAATRRCLPSRPVTPCYLPRRNEEEM